MRAGPRRTGATRTARWRKKPWRGACQCRSGLVSEEEMRILAPKPLDIRDDGAQMRLHRSARRLDIVQVDRVADDAMLAAEMAGMSVEDGLVMQLHPGSWRNDNPRIFVRFGPGITDQRARRKQRIR